MIKAHWDIPQHEWDEGWERWQPTQEWFDLRHAMITATGMIRVLGGKPTRKRYIEGIAFAAKRNPSNASETRGIGADGERGNTLEPLAIAALQEKYPYLPPPRECAFIEITPQMGISPDYVPADLSIAAEIKCFQAESMAEVVLNGIAKKNLPQVMSYFLVPTIKIVLYVVFCPGQDMVDGKDYIKVTEFHRDDLVDEIIAIEEAVELASEEIVNLREKL